MMEGLHFRYNIKSKKFTALLNSLKEKGQEIALHSSLRAFDHPSRYKAEKDKLRTTSNTFISGLRQHYLRGKYPRLWRIAARNGFKYDSSLGYNYQAGYRAGTTHPFYAYDYDREQQYDLIEFSLVFFENNLPKGDEQEKYIQDLITQTREFGGLMVALLHPSNFLKEPFFSMWNNFVEKLKKEKVYINSLSGHYSWRKSREKIKVIRRSGNAVTIEKPADLSHFSIRLYNMQLGDTDKATKVTDLGNHCFRLQSDQHKINLKVE
jgi:hypothetical protein